MARSYFICMVIGFLIFGGLASAEVYRNQCFEDHEPQPSVPAAEKIGCIAGWAAFGLFLEDGGYGTSQSVIDDIEDLNGDYQDGDFDPLQDEASAIHDWLSSSHEIDDGTGTNACSICGTAHTMAQFEAARDTKVGRLHEIDEEIDEAWLDLVDTIRGMISDSAYESYLDAHGLIDGD
jgi:hypothetical protein